MHDKLSNRGQETKVMCSFTFGSNGTIAYVVLAWLHPET